MPLLEGVHDVVGHHVRLAVRHGEKVLFVERLSAPGSAVPRAAGSGGACRRRETGDIAA
jgi:hypothetical protein